VRILLIRLILEELLFSCNVGLAVRHQGTLDSNSSSGLQLRDAAQALSWQTEMLALNLRHNSLIIDTVIPASYKLHLLLQVKILIYTTMNQAASINTRNSGHKGSIILRLSSALRSECRSTHSAIIAGRSPPLLIDLMRMML